MASRTDGYLRVNEIKNYLYCPRISYYALCLHLDRTTDLSEGGIRAEQITKDRMKRRKTALHAVHEGERRFDVQLVSHEQQLIGRIDEIVETPDGCYLVDYKDTDQDYGYWQMQMIAYRLAGLEMGMNILGCYIYTIPSRTYHTLAIKPQDISRLEAILSGLRRMVDREICPEAVGQIGKCRSCQYERFCSDIL